jgi:hypothetical protein
VPTFAFLNTEIRDRFNLLKTSIADDGTLASTGGIVAKPEIKNYVETVNAAAIAVGVLALDLSLGCEFTVSLNAAITSITFSNYPSASKVTTVTIRFTADGTVRAIAWPAAFKWPGASAPTMTGTLNKVDIITARTYDGGTTWYPAIYGQNC